MKKIGEGQIVGPTVFSQFVTNSIFQTGEWEKLSAGTSEYVWEKIKSMFHILGTTLWLWRIRETLCGERD